MKSLKHCVIALLAAGLFAPACATDSNEREVEIEIERPGPDYEEEYKVETDVDKSGGETEITTEVDHEIEDGKKEYEMNSTTKAEIEADGEVETRKKVAIEKEGEGYEFEKTDRSHSELEEDGSFRKHGRTVVESENGSDEFEGSHSYSIEKDSVAMGQTNSPAPKSDDDEVAVWDVQRVDAPAPADMDEEPTAVLGETETREVPMVHFPFDQSSLDSSDKAKLRSYAETLKSSDSATIVVEGHTDEQGTAAYNMALGERRAKAVRDYLASLGIDASRINIVSYGEEQPIANGDSARDHQMNRRAEVEVK